MGGRGSLWLSEMGVGTDVVGIYEIKLSLLNIECAIPSLCPSLGFGWVCDIFFWGSSVVSEDRALRVEQDYSGGARRPSHFLPDAWYKIQPSPLQF